MVVFKTDHGMATSEDPDQTAPKEQSDLGLHCLPAQAFLFDYLEPFW